MATEPAGAMFCATGAAFIELCDAVTSLAGLEGWERLLPTLAPAVRRACEGHEPDASFDEQLYASALHTADDLLADGTGALAREIGKRRGQEVLERDVQEFAADPLRFLKIGAASFYRNRSNYGAAGLELTDDKAVVRFVFPEHFTLPLEGAGQRMPQVVLGFLELVLGTLSGSPQVGRYIGHARRAELRFGQAMYNQHYEFDLDHDGPG